MVLRKYNQGKETITIELTFKHNHTCPKCGLHTGQMPLVMLQKLWHYDGEIVYGQVLLSIG